jgi:1-acyl-sn-glycerol-3-phosphate acyltransferase
LAFGRNLLYFVAGVIPVNRKDKNSKKKAVEKAITALKRGKILVIYPEGTRSRTGEIQKGKFGTAKIFLKTGTPILPVAIKGTFKIFPPGKVFPGIKKIVKVNIGKPFYFKEELEKAKNLNCDSEDYKNLLQQITDKIMEEISHLYKEI